VPPITQRSGALWVWKQRIWGEKKGGLPLSLPLCGCFQVNRIPSQGGVNPQNVNPPGGTGTGMDGRTPSGGFDKQLKENLVFTKRAKRASH
jgi:hypothetical protein